MKTITTILLTAVLMCMPAESMHSRLHTKSVQDTYVYICTGPQSKRYHSNSDCHGLNNCSGYIERVTIAKAKAMKRTACKICYK